LRNAFHCVILSLLQANSSVKADGALFSIAVLCRLNVAFTALTKLLLINLEQSVDATAKDEPSVSSMPPLPDYRYVQILHRPRVIIVYGLTLQMAPKTLYQIQFWSSGCLRSLCMTLRSACVSGRTKNGFFTPLIVSNLLILLSLTILAAKTHQTVQKLLHPA